MSNQSVMSKQLKAFVTLFRRTWADDQYLNLSDTMGHLNFKSLELSHTVDGKYTIILPPKDGLVLWDRSKRIFMNYDQWALQRLVGNIRKQKPLGWITQFVMAYEKEGEDLLEQTTDINSAWKYRLSDKEILQLEPFLLLLAGVKPFGLIESLEVVKQENLQELEVLTEALKQALHPRKKIT